ncbi:MAG: FCD domain-containing protein [Streptosporangiales bacterium]|nr:FCD domain-containing protein [Streptosporangiales bacterium]
MAGPYQRPPTAQQAVLAELRRMIRHGELPPGTQLTQEALAGRLGVSRVPVREALKILQGEGQVVHTPHSGYAVAKLDFDDLLEIKRLRDILEAEAVRRSMRRFTDGDETRMADALRRMADAGDDVGALNVAHREFHFCVFRPAGMPRLLRMLDQLWDSSEAYQSLRHADSHGREGSFEEHSQIFEAARARDASALVKLLNKHRQHTIEELRPVLRDHR